MSYMITKCKINKIPHMPYKQMGNLALIMIYVVYDSL